LGALSAPPAARSRGRARCAGLLLALALPGCAAERLVEREALADPLMGFAPAAVVEPPGGGSPVHAPLPADSLRLALSADGDPGADARAASQATSLRAALELVEGFGLEAGYGEGWSRERVHKLDGFAGPLDLTRLEHGPDAALLYDDGTSLLRAGYRYRTAWDGDRHEPGFSARTHVLGRDTLLEVGYLRRIAFVEVDATHRPAGGEPLDARRDEDCFLAALEQGFLPGVALRLDLEARLEQGFLQSPYRQVSLWSHRPGEPAAPPGAAPQVLPEQHPGSRARFGALLRARFLLPALAGALELGGGYGADTWRVEHARVQLGYHQRLGDLARLSLEGGAYHQIRASFYRDDYPDGPPGSYWTADRQLSAYLAWWAQASLGLAFLPIEGRLMGMFRALHLELGVRVVRSDFGFEDPPNGFSAYDSLAGGAPRAFDAGWGLGGFVGLAAEF